MYWLVAGPSLVAVDPDGGIPYDTFLGPKLLPDIKELRLAGALYHSGTEVPSLAVSSDDRFVYFAGLSTGLGDFRKAQPVPCVFRVDTAKRGPAEVFLGGAVGLAALTLVTVLAGGAVARRVPTVLVTRSAAVLFIVAGTLTLWTAF